MELVEGEPPYMDTAPIRALFFITTRGIPDLKQPGRWYSLIERKKETQKRERRYLKKI